jgi:polyhydroxybutyrate depolymerase
LKGEFDMDFKRNKPILVLLLFVVGIWSAGCGSIQSTEKPTAQPTTSSTLQATGTSEPTATAALAPTSPPQATSTPQSALEHQTPGDHIVSMIVAGAERQFLLHVPPGYEPGVPVPLVFNLHGYSGTAAAQERYSYMNVKADEEGFLVVNPQAQGSPARWWGTVYGQTGEADMAFFHEMLDYLQREMSIDPDRIYATGVSNGATMTNRLGCDMSDVFAAIAPVAGGHALYDLCRLDQPISVLVLHGTQDDSIPYHGDDSGIPPVHSWVEAWAKRNRCNSKPSVDQPYETVTAETWGDCAGDVVVRLLSIEGGRHEWPGAAYGPGPWPEGMTPDIYANDVIWEFFEAHPKTKASAQAFQVRPKPTLAPRPTLEAEYREPGTFRGALEVEGYQRQFIVHIPPGYQPGVPLPLVINLHAYTHSVFQQEELSQMHAKADEEGFIVVHPQALGNPTAWYGYLPGLPGEIDKRFFAELLAHLQQEISIDPARIYAAGLSDGGAMANMLACEMSDTFAAVAPVSGFHGNLDNCVVSRPVSVLAIHGTADPVLPYDGVESEIPPVRLWVEAWAQRNRCDLTPSVEHPQEGLTVETWQNCDENTTVILYTREGGDHIWPGSESGEQMEGTPANINATDVIWDFFESHPRP